MGKKQMSHDQAPFLQRFFTLKAGYQTVEYQGHSYGMTVSISSDGKRRKLYAEQLGGNDHISFNLYLLDQQAPLLKPCEMPAEKVMDFVQQFTLTD